MVGVGRVVRVRGILGISEGYGRNLKKLRTRKMFVMTRYTLCNLRFAIRSSYEEVMPNYDSSCIGDVPSWQKAKCIKCYIGGDMVSCSPPPLVLTPLWH